jgi:hypothetical protein
MFHVDGTRRRRTMDDARRRWYAQWRAARFARWIREGLASVR